MNQLALSWEAAQDGIQRSADHAEAVEAGWADGAYAILWSYAQQCPGGFTGEGLREHMAAVGFAVPVPKALGQVLLKAARVGIIEKVGFVPAKQRHCSPTVLWRGRKA